MINTIYISTTPAGLKLYTAATENLDFYIKHLDNINKWKYQLEKIHSLSPTSFKEDDYHSFHTQLKINGLLTISVLDLSIIARELFIAKHNWEKFFYAKQSYLVIYETINTYNIHCKFLDAIAKKLNQKLEAEFKTISNQIKVFKKDFKFDTEIKEIRKRTAGHIDKDFSKYYDTLRNINFQKAMETIQAFMVIISKLQIFSSHLMKDYNDKIKNLNQISNNEIFTKLLELAQKFDSLNRNVK